MALDFKKYDQRKYQTVDVVDGYSLWSESYERNFDEALDMRLLSRIQCIDWKGVRSALDLACGTGRTGLWLKSKGVQFLDGVDFTDSMLIRAKAKNIYRQLRKEDVRSTSFGANSYDLVINSLAVEHLPEIMPLFQEALRLLQPGGHFLVLGYHPHFQLRGIPTHFDNPSGDPIAIVNYIHLISDFVKTGLMLNFEMRALDECVVDESWAKRSPGMRKHLGHPISFLGIWKKSIS